jgi:hypothetical protein
MVVYAGVRRSQRHQGASLSVGPVAPRPKQENLRRTSQYASGVTVSQQQQFQADGIRQFTDHADRRFVSDATLTMPHSSQIQVGRAMRGAATADGGAVVIRKNNYDELPDWMGRMSSLNSTPTTRQRMAEFQHHEENRRLHVESGTRRKVAATRIARPPDREEEPFISQYPYERVMNPDRSAMRAEPTLPHASAQTVVTPPLVGENTRNVPSGSTVTNTNMGSSVAAPTTAPVQPPPRGVQPAGRPRVRSERLVSRQAVSSHHDVRATARTTPGSWLQRMRGQVGLVAEYFFPGNPKPNQPYPPGPRAAATSHAAAAHSTSFPRGDHDRAMDPRPSVPNTVHLSDRGTTAVPMDIGDRVGSMPLGRGNVGTQSAHPEAFHNMPPADRDTHRVHRGSVHNTAYSGMASILDVSSWVATRPEHTQDPQNNTPLAQQTFPNVPLMVTGRNAIQSTHTAQPTLALDTMVDPVIILDRGSMNQAMDGGRPIPQSAPATASSVVGQLDRSAAQPPARWEGFPVVTSVMSAPVVSDDPRTQSTGPSAKTHVSASGAYVPAVDVMVTPHTRMQSAGPSAKTQAPASGAYVPAVDVMVTPHTRMHPRESAATTRRGGTASIGAAIQNMPQPVVPIGDERESVPIHAVRKRKREAWDDRVAPFTTYLGQTTAVDGRNPNIFGGPR